jgi:hypothetical protein
MAKRQTTTKPKAAPKKVAEIPAEWDKKRLTEEVSIVMDGKDFTVSVDLAKVLIQKGKAEAK